MDRVGGVTEGVQHQRAVAPGVAEGAAGEGRAAVGERLAQGLHALLDDGGQGLVRDGEAQVDRGRGFHGDGGAGLPRGVGGRREAHHKALVQRVGGEGDADVLHRETEPPEGAVQRAEAPEGVRVGVQVGVVQQEHGRGVRAAVQRGDARVGLEGALAGGEGGEPADGRPAEGLRQQAGRVALAAADRAADEQRGADGGAGAEVEGVLVGERVASGVEARFEASGQFVQREGLKRGLGRGDGLGLALDEAQALQHVLVEGEVAQAALQLLAGEGVHGLARVLCGGAGLLRLLNELVALGPGGVHATHGFGQFARGVPAQLVLEGAAGLGVLEREVVHLAQQGQAAGFEILEVALDVGLAGGLAALLQRRAELLDAAQGFEQVAPQVGLAPDVAHGADRALHGAGDGRAGVDGRDGLAQLVEPGVLPLFVDQLLQAAAAAGIQAALGREAALGGGQAGVHRGRQHAPVAVDPGLVVLPGFGGAPLCFFGLFRFISFIGFFGGFRLLRGIFRRFGNGRLGGRFDLRRGLFRCGLFVGMLLGGGLLCGRGDDLVRREDGEGERVLVEAGKVEGLQVVRGAGLAVGDEAAGDLVVRVGDPAVALGVQRLALQKHRRGAGGGAEGAGIGFGEDLQDRVRRGLAHDVGVDDEGVLLRGALAVVLVGADLVVVVGVGAQVHHAKQAHLAHARLEAVGFVFIRHDADAALLGVGVGFGIGDVAAVRLDQHRFEAEIGFLGIVFLQYADTEFSGQ